MSMMHPSTLNITSEPPSGSVSACGSKADAHVCSWPSCETNSMSSNIRWWEGQTGHNSNSGIQGERGGHVSSTARCGVVRDIGGEGVDGNAWVSHRPHNNTSNVGFPRRAQHTRLDLALFLSPASPRRPMYIHMFSLFLRTTAHAYQLPLGW